VNLSNEVNYSNKAFATISFIFFPFVEEVILLLFYVFRFVFEDSVQGARV